MYEKLNEQKVLDFLNDLDNLTRLHGLSINGCGCCGSPYLEQLDLKEYNPEYSYSVLYSNKEYIELTYDNKHEQKINIKFKKIK